MVLAGNKKKSDRQTTRIFSNMHHRHGLKVNYSVGGRGHYCSDERQTSKGLSARESVHFLPPDFIKRRFTGLSVEHHCCQGVGGEGWWGCRDSAAHVWTPICKTVSMQGLEGVHARASANACVVFCACCVSVHTPLAQTQVAECLFKQWPLPTPHLTGQRWKTRVSLMRADGAWDIPYRLGLVALG